MVERVAGILAVRVVRLDGTRMEREKRSGPACRRASGLFRNHLARDVCVWARDMAQARRSVYAGLRDIRAVRAFRTNSGCADRHLRAAASCRLARGSSPGG